jgi:hypothetical protein
LGKWGDGLITEREGVRWGNKWERESGEWREREGDRRVINEGLMKRERVGVGSGKKGTVWVLVW